MSYMDEVLKLAIQHHHGQKYLDQTYLDGHIYPVALQAEMIAKGAGLSNTEIDVVNSIAYGHDLLEDTTVTLDMIEGLDRVPLAVPFAIDALTKRIGVSQSDYLQGIVGCSIYATVVKLADSLVNLRTSLSTGSTSRMLEYSNNVSYLTTAVSREIERRKGSV